MGESRDLSDALGAVSLSEYGNVLLHRTIERVVPALYRTLHGPLRDEWVRESREDSEAARVALAYPTPKHSLSNIILECYEGESEGLLGSLHLVVLRDVQSRARAPAASPSQQPSSSLSKLKKKTTEGVHQSRESEVEARIARLQEERRERAHSSSLEGAGSRSGWGGIVKTVAPKDSRREGKENSSPYSGPRPPGRLPGWQGVKQSVGTNPHRDMYPVPRAFIDESVVRGRIKRRLALLPELQQELLTALDDAVLRPFGPKPVW